MKTHIRLEKTNALVDRINAIEFHGKDAEACADQLKHLLLCQCLNPYGIKTASRMIEIWEKWNYRK